MRTTQLSRSFFSVGAAVALGLTLFGCGSGAGTDTVDTTTTSGGSDMNTDGNANNQDDDNGEPANSKDLDQESADGTPLSEVPELDPDGLDGEVGTPESLPDDVSSDEVMDIVDQLVGMTEAEATELAESVGLSVRVEERDGESFALTMDYDERRVNFVVEGDRIAGARIG